MFVVRYWMMGRDDIIDTKLVSSSGLRWITCLNTGNLVACLMTELSVTVLR
jgi:hypothetical protein